jgi:GntR family transcriptional regulator, transcriptional repressor for pyruvate dehydrogenase complex
VNDNGSSKLYIEIVNQLRNMISSDGLKSGDKIPSERELSERLKVGRSSVREALRALELLGLIETRRGEGTFIKDFHENHLVKLVSTFILQDEKSKQDVIDTKYLIEMDCLRLLLQKKETENWDLNKWSDKDSLNDDEFFYLIIENLGNHLLLKIWLILKDYHQSLNFGKNEYSKTELHNLLHAIQANDEHKTLSAYRELRRISSALKQ